jgi:hypothetical protein
MPFLQKAAGRGLPALLVPFANLNLKCHNLWDYVFDGCLWQVW